MLLEKRYEQKSAQKKPFYSYVFNTSGWFMVRLNRTYFAKTKNLLLKTL